MKQTDRLKKEKSPTVKTQILNPKKEQKKGPLRKEETNIPKSTCLPTQRSASRPLATRRW
jgi:hypothetical protein